MAQIPSRRQSTGCGMMVVLFAILISGGCAASLLPPCAPEPSSQRHQDGAKGWWHAACQIAWPQDEEPSWYVDAMIAHRVFAPVLQTHKDALDFWRFHRRAARDAAGHRFSLIFYSTRLTADRIYKEIRSNGELLSWVSDGTIIRESYDSTDKILKPHLEDTTDRSWSPPLQRSWPPFIMGVSEMWLALVSNLAEQELNTKKPTRDDELRQCYMRAYQRVGLCWQQEGGHALLHHLSAVFGYEPVRVKGDQWMQF